MSGIIQFEKFCERKTSSLKYALAIEVLQEFRNIRAPNRPRRQSKSHVPMTDAIRRRIINYHYSTKLSQSDIAARVSVNQGRVNEIINGA